MIRSVTVTNHLGESIKLVLTKPEESGFAITGITGLGPVKATVNMTEVATSDGGIFNSSRLSSRNIVLSLVFLWKDTIEDTRQRAYKYFPIKKTVTLLIETDNRIVKTEGIVESNEPDIFSDQEGTEISIICPFPYFYSGGDDGTVTTLFGAVEPAFEFPFSNESLTENLIEIAVLYEETEKIITYSGDVDVGVTIKIHAVGDVSMINIYNVDAGEVMKIDTDKIESYTGSGIIAGDDIIICTVKNNKSIVLVRDGVTTNILNCISKDSDWFQLASGENTFAYTAEDGIENLQFRMENQILYEGV